MTAVEGRAGPAATIGDALTGVVARYGDRPAVRADGEEITYRELWSRAAAIARLVREAGPFDPPHVAVLADQGIDALAAILAVVQSGEAYLSLDPGDPAERLRWICQDADVGLVLTSSGHAALARDIVGDRMRITEDASAGGEPLGVRQDRPDGVGFLVYTSGSTGQPKGVIQTHRNMLRYAAAFGDCLSIGPGDRLTLLYTLSFAAANIDIFGGLLHGATLCLYDARRRGVEALPAWIATERITVLHTVPTVFRYLAEHPPKSGFETVRAIDLGGEPVFRSDVRRCREAFGPETLLVNHYAATEVSVIAQHVAGLGDEAGDAQLPAGIAPHGVELLVLDEGGSEVAPGEVGEIVVRSAHLSPGYWRRPELSAAAFADDAQIAGMRRYRTGDAGRRDDDGVLTVLGRLDSRVKIRGHSIEPAEVEEALRSLPGVRDAIVEVERVGSGVEAEVRLVGYVVAADAAPSGSQLDGAALRGALSDHLPPHMLPAALRVVEAFPLTRTGKVDRAALSALEAVEPVGGEALADEAEKRVAAIYARILDVAVTSRRDDFFMLGGTSMTLAQLQTELRHELGGELDLADAMRSASVADVAASVVASRADDANRRDGWDEAGAATSSDLVVALRTAGHASPLVLIHGWHGQAFVTPGFVAAVPEDHPVFSVQARGLIDGARPHRSVAAMAEEYLRAAQAIGHAAPPILVGICAGGVIAVEMARLARQQTGRQLPVVMLDPPYPPYAQPLPRRLRDLAAFYLSLAPLRFGPAKWVTKHIARRLRARAERIGTPNLDSPTLENDAAVRVALSVGIALRRHRPGVYDGPVYVIASQRRLSGATWRSGTWQRVLSGPLELIGAGDDHMDVLNPASSAFPPALRRAIGAIDEMESSLARKGSAGS